LVARRNTAGIAEFISTALEKTSKIPAAIPASVVSPLLATFRKIFFADFLLAGELYGQGKVQKEPLNHGLVKAMPQAL